MSKPKLGIAGDFIGSGTGFGEVLLNLVNNLKDKYQISQLAINYSGDFSEHQKDIRLYTCGGEKDAYGINKIARFVEQERLDILMVLNDPWLADRLILKVREKHPNLKVLLYTPVDSEGLHRSYVSILNMYDHVVTYTEFAKEQLINAGLTKQCDVIPHGVDVSTYYPIYRDVARVALDIPDKFGFIVGYVGQNQPRKKVDHFIWLFNQWQNKYYHEDAAFYYHGPIVRQNGINVPWYIEHLDSKNKDFKLADKFLTTSDNPRFVASRELMNYIFNVFDLFLQPAANEGWGMGAHQSMACGKCTLVPEHSALAEWPKGGVFYVPVLDIPNIYESGIGTDHKVIDPHWAVEALETLYQNATLRNELASAGYRVAVQDKYNWSNISAQFDNIFSELLKGE